MRFFTIWTLWGLNMHRFCLGPSKTHVFSLSGPFGPQIYSLNIHKVCPGPSNHGNHNFLGHLLFYLYVLHVILCFEASWSIMCHKPQNLHGLGAQWARNLAIYEVWVASGPNAQNMLSEAHSGHIWANAGKMFKIGLLRPMLAISGPRLPRCSK